MTIDIKDFYLMTPMARYECMRLKLADLPNHVIEQYNLRERVTKDCYIYLEIRQVMYRLPQARIIAQQQLEKRLKKRGINKSNLPLVYGRTQHA